MFASGMELTLLLVIVAVVFGAGKLPQVMEALGHGVKQFREASREVDDVARSLDGQGSDRKG